VSHFFLESILGKRNLIEKQVVKPSEYDGFATPKNIPESRRKIVWPNEFRREKKMGRNKIKNVLIISEAKLRLISPLCIKVYVGNTPSIHRLMMMGHLLAAPKGYAH
jgi:hypothetical protein